MIRTMRGRLSVLCTGSILLMASIAHSEVTSYNSFAAWSGASPIFTTLDFTSVGDGYVTDQYASLGAVFAEGDDYAFISGGLFPQDGWGVVGSYFGSGSVTVQVLSAIPAFGAFYTGGLLRRRRRLI